jgi:raffinose/stachyose/melibiose transport system permease protein
MIAEKNPVKRLGNQLFFTGPTFLAFVPFGYGLYLTLFEMAGVQSTPVFVGVENYVMALQDTEFWASMWVTLKYVGATVVFVNILGFALAYLVTAGVKGQNFFRTALFTPNLIGGLVLGYIWQFVFVTSLPVFGERFDIEILKLGWLGDEVLAFWALVIVTIWQSAGYMMIIFIAGIMNVPKDIIEASTIDGANGWQRLINMTLPMMVPSFVVTIFLTLKGAFMVYDINYALTQGGPYGSTKMASMHVVGLAFDQNNFGLGQAEAIVLFAVVAIATGLQVYFSKRLEVEA